MYEQPVNFNWDSREGKTLRNDGANVGANLYRQNRYAPGYLLFEAFIHEDTRHMRETRRDPDLSEQLNQNEALLQQVLLLRSLTWTAQTSQLQL